MGPRHSKQYYAWELVQITPGGPFTCRSPQPATKLSEFKEAVATLPPHVAKFSFTINYREPCEPEEKCNLEDDKEAPCEACFRAYVEKHVLPFVPFDRTIEYIEPTTSSPVAAGIAGVVVGGAGGAALAAAAINGAPVLGATVAEFMFGLSAGAAAGAAAVATVGVAVVVGIVAIGIYKLICYLTRDPTRIIITYKLLTEDQAKTVQQELSTRYYVNPRTDSEPTASTVDKKVSQSEIDEKQSADVKREGFVIVNRSDEGEPGSGSGTVVQLATLHDTDRFVDVSID